MAAPGDVSRSGAVARRRSRRNRPAITPTRTQVARAGSSSRATRAAQAGYVSQGAAVAHGAYLANPVRARRSEVRQARATPSAQRTGGQHLLLGTHGQRTSARGRKRAAIARTTRAAEEHYTSTSTPRSDIHDLTKPFKGFRDYEKRAMAGKTTPVERAEAARVAAAGAKAPAWFRGAKAGTLFAMEQLLRPSAATGAATLERNKGGSSVGTRAHAFVQGFLHPEAHSGDWVKAAREGHWPVPAVTGTAASMAADPTSYVSFGAATPAKAAALKVYARALEQGVARHEAVAAAREVWEQAPAHLKVPGVKVGVSGIPTRVIGRRSLSTGASSLGAGRVVTAARKAGISHAPQVTSKGRLRSTIRQVAPNVRPHNVDPLDWEFIKRAGTQGRAGERAAVRLAEETLHGYHRTLTKDHTPERGLELMKRLESVPHVHTEDDLKRATQGLSDREAQAVRQAAVDRAVQYATEPGRTPLLPESRMGFVHKPVSRGYEGSDVAASKRVLEKAERRMAAATRAHGEEKGRRAVLGWRIGQQRTKSLGQERAAQELEDAAEHLKLARQAHRAETGKAARDRKTYREFIRQTQAYQRAAPGYVHRTLKPDALVNGPARTGGGAKVGGSSYQSRSFTTPLEHLPPEHLERLETRLPVVMAERALEHGRNKNVANINDWIGSLGRQVEHGHVAAAIDSKARLYVQDERGFSPLFDKFGKVDREAAEHAIEHGHRVVEIPEQYDEMVRDLARGRRPARGSDPFELVGRDTAEQGGTVGLATTATRKIKFLQTQVNPSYWIRNFLGDYLNMNIGGAGVADVVAARRLLKAHGANRAALRTLHSTPEGRKAALALRKAVDRETHYAGLGRKASDLEVVRLAAANGAIDTGLLQGELMAARHGVDTSQLTKAGKAKDALARGNDYRENLIRLATFRGALRNGMDPEAAAQWSLKHHFDYGDLSPAEQSFFRNLFPFWTFMARNTPLQVAALVRRPGVLANVEKMRRGSLTAAGLDPNLSEGSENFEQTNLAWGTPFKNKYGAFTAAPGLSTMDLSNIPTSLTDESLKQAGGNIIGRSHPFFTAGVLGALANKNPLNLQDLPPYVQAPSWWTAAQNLPGVPDIIPTRDPRTGRPARSLPGRLSPALNILPLSQVAMKVGTKPPPGAPSALALRGASWALGPRIAVENPHQRAITQAFHRIDQIDHELKRLEPRVLSHKSGDEWGGKIRRRLDEKKKLEQLIYKHSKAMGAKNPLGRAPAKGRKGKAGKIPGGLGGGAFGSGGFQGGGFGG